MLLALALVAAVAMIVLGAIGVIAGAMLLALGQGDSLEQTAFACSFAGGFALFIAGAAVILELCR